jgi:4-amino-4-deoxy-L-arabinose transferase-like glycosyltransferase
VGLIVAGVALRVLACVAVWPVGLGLDDSAAYTGAALHSPLSDVQHPAGYPLFLDLVGVITRQLGAVVILQHLLGVLAAVIVFAAVRRATGSAWLALVPAGALLLDSDQVFLEHNVMAEGIVAPLIAATLYAGVRVLQDSRSLRWAAVLGFLVGVDGLTRSAAIALVLVVPAAILLSRGTRRERVFSSALATGVAVLVLVAYAFANLAYSGEFEIGPRPGWHLYGMVAHYADCALFTPPPGTQPLCQSTPIQSRPGINFYLYSADSPAQRTFGWFTHDSEVGAFAEQVVLHEPGHYLRNVASNLAAYFAPSSYPAAYGGIKLGYELDWRRRSPDEHRLTQVLQTYFAPFRSHSDTTLRRALGAWEQVFRFGAPLLVLTTLLTAAGLLYADRRALLILFGVGGLSLLIAPSVIGDYVGRYSVPLVAPMAGAAAIAGQVLWRRLQGVRYAKRAADRTA